MAETELTSKAAAALAAKRVCDPGGAAPALGKPQAKTADDPAVEGASGTASVECLDDIGRSCGDQSGSGLHSQHVGTDGRRRAGERVNRNCGHDDSEKHAEVLPLHVRHSDRRPTAKFWARRGHRTRSTASRRRKRCYRGPAAQPLSLLVCRTCINVAVYLNVRRQDLQPFHTTRKHARLSGQDHLRRPASRPAPGPHPSAVAREK